MNNWKEEYPINTFHGETKNELIDFIQSLLDSRKEVQGSTTKKNLVVQGSWGERFDKKFIPFYQEGGYEGMPDFVECKAEKIKQFISEEIDKAYRQGGLDTEKAMMSEDPDAIWLCPDCNCMTKRVCAKCAEQAVNDSIRWERDADNGVAKAVKKALQAKVEEIESDIRTISPSFANVDPESFNDARDQIILIIKSKGTK